jgi:hypothetical protein
MGVHAMAVASCVTCGRQIEDWRERFTPIVKAELFVEASATLAIRLRAPGACSCGGDEMEIRVLDTH